MKQLARYKILFDGKAIRASVGFMAVAFFCRILYFFVVNPIQNISVVDLILCLILPALLEVSWIVLLHIAKRNAPGIYGILCCGFCLFLAIQVGLNAGLVRTILSAVLYLLCCGVSLVITGGYFPYKYIGMGLFLLIGLTRFLIFDMGGYIRCGDWNGFVLEAAGLATLCALALFFGGITGIPCKKE